MSVPDERQPLIRRATTRVGSFIQDFKNFVDKGNVVDLAIGIVIGNAFSEVVTSFVGDIFTPVIGLMVSSKLTEKFAVIKKGPHYPYNTRDEAREDGAVTWNYGNFTQILINFWIISFSLFVIVRILQTRKKKQKIQTDVLKECDYCFSDIDGRARKCPSCTADL